MTDNRGTPPPAYFQPGGPGYQRVMQKIDEGMGAVSDRMEAAFGRIDKRLERMERDIAQGEVDRASQSREMAEIRRDLGEVRDAAKIASTAAVEEARSAAEGATEVVKKATKKKWWEMWQAWGIALVAFIAVYKNLGTLARDMTSFWLYIIGPNHPAEIHRPAPKGVNDAASD